MISKITINTDGGARGNPGPAAIGVVITKENEVIKIGKYIGKTTNNVAEYSALLEALNNVLDDRKAPIECLLDSELVVKQINGQYKVKDENLKVLWLQIKQVQNNFTNISFKHIPRAQNNIADKIVNEVLDSPNLSF